MSGTHGPAYGRKGMGRVVALSICMIGFLGLLAAWWIVCSAEKVSYT